ncbi:hypothetical protein DWQ65_05020 [Treponema phagedenis]|uniref:Uncharacterized protein n=1 Tax=Treponema phagedenis TaxID=162 RepID=A0A0B7GSG7_TREPH|nr:hypothetical protein [Treponema phagedenis]QSH99432.1 hypothetical protein DWQ65_05020 [Treponema phagedenis]CEM60442.1 conserved exported hypothetical protein [Treponema phagedenis]
MKKPAVLIYSVFFLSALFSETPFTEIWYKNDGLQNCSVSFIRKKDRSAFVFQYTVDGEFYWDSGTITGQTDSEAEGVFFQQNKNITETCKAIFTLDSTDLHIRINGTPPTAGAQFSYAGRYCRDKSRLRVISDNSIFFKTEKQRHAFQSLCGSEQDFILKYMKYYLPIPSKDHFITRAYEIFSSLEQKKPPMLLAFSDDFVYFIFYDPRPRPYPEIRFFLNAPRYKMLPSTFYHYVTIHDDAVFVRH